MPSVPTCLRDALAEGGLLRLYYFHYKTMRQCAICHKGSRMGGARKLLRGHYNPVNWTRKYPNLQYARVKGERMLVCTNCLWTLHKTVARADARAPVGATAAAAAAK